MLNIIPVNSKFNIEEDGKLLLPFNVDAVYNDFVIRAWNPHTNVHKFNLFNKNTKKIHFPYWFDKISHPKIIGLTINDKQYKTSLCEVIINNYSNLMNYNGEFLFSKWIFYHEHNYRVRNFTKYKKIINYDLLTQVDNFENSMK